MQRGREIAITGDWKRSHRIELNVKFYEIKVN